MDPRPMLLPRRLARLLPRSRTIRTQSLLQSQRGSLQRTCYCGPSPARASLAMDGTFPHVPRRRGGAG